LGKFESTFVDRAGVTQHNGLMIVQWQNNGEVILQKFALHVFPESQAPYLGIFCLLLS
jgi:hypothetical protein